MVTIRTLPVYEVVRRVYPRPPPDEADEVAKAEGRAIDGALSRFGHEIRLGRRPTASAMNLLAESLFDEAIEEAGMRLDGAARAVSGARIRGAVRAYRKSDLYGLARPKTRVILIAGRVGVYAQPDYWNGRSRFFEMKSYAAIPPPPDVNLQMRLFQLAFPQLGAVLVCINRHSNPVETTSAVIAPLSPEEEAATLRLAYEAGSQVGTEKVLEYMAGPFVRYALPSTGSSDEETRQRPSAL